MVVLYQEETVSMKKLTMEVLRSWQPCYDPNRHLPEDWSGTIIDLLKHPNIPHADKLWCALRTDVTTERTMRLFAVWSYRQTLKFVTNPDPRSVAAADTAERYANGTATLAELESARSAAWSAAAAAESAAARLAAWSAAWSAWSAAWSAAAERDQLNKLIEMIEAESI